MLYIDSRCNFGEGYAIWHQLEDRPLGHVQHLLAPLKSVRGVISYLFHHLKKFLILSLLDNLEFPVDYLDR